MKYLEDEEFIKKQLYDAKANSVDKLLRRYFVVIEKK